MTFTATRSTTGTGERSMPTTGSIKRQVTLVLLISLTSGPPLWAGRSGKTHCSFSLIPKASGFLSLRILWWSFRALSLRRLPSRILTLDLAQPQLQTVFIRRSSIFTTRHREQGPLVLVASVQTTPRAAPALGD